MSSDDTTLRHACSAVVLVATTVCACYADVPTVVFEFEAEADLACTNFQIRSDWGSTDSLTQTWTWKLSNPREMCSDGVLLARLDEYEITLVEDPQINHNFSVQSGSSVTTFHNASGLLTFPSIINAAGWLNVTFVALDTNGDGATLEGTYLAQYNGWAGDPPGPQGATFGECDFSVEAGPYESVFVTCNISPTPLPGEIRDMSALANFTLSAHDLVSAVISYVVVPCYSDLDGDNSVDLDDLCFLLQNYGVTHGASYADGDLNVDGAVDLEDLATLLSLYGSTCE